MLDKKIKEEMEMKTKRIICRKCGRKDSVDREVPINRLRCGRQLQPRSRLNDDICEGRFKLDK